MYVSKKENYAACQYHTDIYPTFLIQTTSCSYEIDIITLTYLNSKLFEKYKTMVTRDQVLKSRKIHSINIADLKKM